MNTNELNIFLRMQGGGEELREEFFDAENADHVARAFQRFGF